MSAPTNAEKRARRALNALTIVAQSSSVSSPGGANLALRPLLGLTSETRRGNMAQALAGAAGEGGKTQLMAAAVNGDEESLEFIRKAKPLAAAARILDRQDDYGKTALIWAAEANKTESVNALIANGKRPNVNIHENNGNTALHYASHNGNLEIVTVLLAADANVDAVDNDGRTSLYNASRMGHEEIVRLLLQGGATVDIATESGKTPLYIAVAFRRADIDVVQLLIDYEANVNARDNIEGVTPLHTAVRGYFSDGVRVLVDAGADVNAPNNNGDTPLVFATERNHTNIMRILLDSGAGINLANNEGWTPLHFACDRNHFEAVYLLLQFGADSNSQDQDGNTPVQLTTDENIISLFIQHMGGRRRTRRAPSRKRRGARHSRPTARSRRGA